MIYEGFFTLGLLTNLITGELPSEKLVKFASAYEFIPTEQQLISSGSGADGGALYAIALNRELPQAVRVRAASFLGILSSKNVEPHIEALILDKQLDLAQIRTQALFALTRRNPSRAELLGARLFNDLKDTSARIAIIDALVSKNRIERVKNLVQESKNDTLNQHMKSKLKDLSQ